MDNSRKRSGEDIPENEPVKRINAMLRKLGIFEQEQQDYVGTQKQKFALHLSEITRERDREEARADASQPVAKPTPARTHLLAIATICMKGTVPPGNPATAWDQICEYVRTATPRET